MSHSLFYSNIDDHIKAKILLEFNSIKNYLLYYIKKNNLEDSFFDLEIRELAEENARGNIEEYDVEEEWDDDEARAEFYAEGYSIDDCEYQTWEEAIEEYAESIYYTIAVKLIKKYLNTNDNDFVIAAAKIIEECQL